MQADHEKFCRRAKEVQVAKEDFRDASPAAASNSEAASLYKKQDLSLKQGETLKCGLLQADLDTELIPALCCGGGPSYFRKMEACKQIGAVQRFPAARLCLHRAGST